MSQASTTLSAHSEAALLVASADPLALADLDARIATWRDGLPRTVSDFTARWPTTRPPRAPVLRDFITTVLKSILVRRKAEDLRRTIDPSTTAGPTLAEEVMGLVLEWGGPRVAESVRALKHELQDGLRQKLAEVDAKLRGYGQPPKDRPRAGIAYFTPELGPHSFTERRVTEAKALVEQRRDLVDRIAALEPAEAGDITSHRAAHVSKAINGPGGGASAVAARVAEVRLARGVFFSSDPAGAELNALEARAATVRESLAGIAAAPGATAGAYETELKAEAAALAEKIMVLLPAINERQTAAIAGMVARAAAGDEEARQALYSEVRSRPEAWPTGFEQALEYTAPVLETVEGLLGELERRLAPPAE